MLNKETNQKKIIINKGKIITREELFERKEQFHKDQAKLPFEEKIKILVNMQKIVIGIKGESEKTMIWKIY